MNLYTYINIFCYLQIDFSIFSICTFLSYFVSYFFEFVVFHVLFSYFPIFAFSFPCYIARAAAGGGAANEIEQKKKGKYYNFNKGKG